VKKEKHLAFSLTAITNGPLELRIWNIARRRIIKIPVSYVSNITVTKTATVQNVWVPEVSDWPPGARTANGTALCH